ncbi:IPT/TIG domain-containing protein [Agromyces sp. M3QZ16-3]|uniref:IPT/TIG domain-containing protein n=1 Tax=Agromyces sp. M3QZ16-3 TaxID=3447585 RepID=UPI003F693F1A
MSEYLKEWWKQPWVRWDHLAPLQPKLSVTDVSPREGWPGTVVEIRGTRFDANRDADVVMIGGDRALVLEASAERLLVMAGEQTQSGPITVEVAGKLADGGEFSVLDWPDPDDPTTHGAPRFFHGPQDGTPQTNRTNQRVMTIITYPTDHDPGGAVARANLRTDIINRVDTARDYWNRASYGSTTWSVDVTDWVPLPQPRRTYFWEQRDIDDARLHYLSLARTMIRDGSSIITSTSGAGFIPIDHPSPLSWSFLLGKAPDATPVRALKRVGSTLYVGTAGGRFAVYDASTPGSAVLRGAVDLGNPVWDIDVTGTTAFVALGPGGIARVDVSNPALPSVLAPGVGTGSNWTTRVAVAGGRVYSNRGATLRVDTISGGGGLTNLAALGLDEWITDIVVAGSICAVATDGAGLVAVEVTPGGAVVRGEHAEHPHLRSIRLAGTRAFAAASEDGLVAYDLSNLAAPVKLGVRKFRKPAYALSVTGDEAVVAVGSTVLVSVKISDPTNMAVNGTELDSGSEGDLPGRRAALHLAIDGQNLIKDANRFYVDALRAWYATTGRSMADLDSYEGVVVVVNGPFLRGQSGLSSGFDAGAGRIENFNAKKGVFYVASNFTWDRFAHEIVHWLGISDIYEEAFSNGTILAGSAEAWCMSGLHHLGPLFSAQRTADILKWWTIGDAPSDNVKQLTWSATTQLDQSFDLVAHGATADAASDRWHALKLVAASGLAYWVELRQASPPGLPFDQNLPVPAGQPGRVVVIRATEEKSVLNNTFERPLQLMGALREGQQAVDAIRNLVITVESEVQPDPLVQRVRVRWNQPIPDTPDGTFDMTITPWNLTTYETVDIWIDSSRGPAGTYDFHEEGDPGRPILSGDRPWVGHDNTIHARVRNTGPQKAEHVWVSCYITQPPGIGDNGDWQLLETTEVAEIPGHGEVVVDFAWRPSVAAHTCISVAVLPQLGEIDVDNNFAQENVAIFDSPSSSSHKPVILAAEVRSPFTILKRIDLIVDRLPEGWHAVVDTSHVWLEDHASAPVRTIIWTDVETWGLEFGPGERLALPTVSGWTRYVDEYRSIGGILAPVRAVPGVKIDFGLEAGGDALYVWGVLEPGAWDVPIVVEIVDEHGETWRLYTTSESDGRFHASTPDDGITLEPGTYSVQVFTSGSPNAAETESAIQVVDLT